MKDTIKMMKRQVTDGEEVFASHVSDTGLPPTDSEEPSKLDHNKPDKPNEKRDKESKQILHQRKHMMAITP